MRNEIQWEKTKAWGVTVQLHTARSSLAKAAQGPFIPLKLAGALSSRVKEPQRVRETGDPALIDAHMLHPPLPLGVLWCLLNKEAASLPLLIQHCLQGGREGPGEGRGEGQRVPGRSATVPRISYPVTPFPRLHCT